MVLLQIARLSEDSYSTMLMEGTSSTMIEIALRTMMGVEGRKSVYCCHFSSDVLFWFTYCMESLCHHGYVIHRVTDKRLPRSTFGDSYVFPVSCFINILSAVILVYIYFVSAVAKRIKHACSTVFL